MIVVVKNAQHECRCKAHRTVLLDMARGENVSCGDRRKKKGQSRIRMWKSRKVLPMARLNDLKLVLRRKRHSMEEGIDKLGLVNASNA